MNTKLKTDNVSNINVFYNETTPTIINLSAEGVTTPRNKLRGF